MSSRQSRKIVIPGKQAARHPGVAFILDPIDPFSIGNVPLFPAGECEEKGQSLQMN
jgi:hypothetical protein